MRFIVATLPDVKFNLGRDVALAKASALFGDETVLFSPTYCGIEPFLDFSDKSVLHQLIWLSTLSRDPGFVQGEELTSAQRDSRIKVAAEKSKAFIDQGLRWIELESSTFGLTSEQLEERNRIATETKAIAQRIHHVFSDNVEYIQRARELMKGEELGLIRIQQINEEPTLYFNKAKLVSDISTALSAADAYGALDERFVTPFKASSEGQIHKLRVTRVAAEMFQRLPFFEKASFDEIRDIKRELEPYLANFRRGLIEISQQIRSQPWDDDFPHEVERELRVRLMPEVAALEDKVKANAYLMQIVHRAAKEPLVLPAASALGIVLSTTLHASTIASQVVSAIVGGGLLAFEAYKEWKEEDRKAKENIFFFYYRVGKLLSRR